MTPAARIAAVIELLDGLAPDAPPAEQQASAYLRQRRYIGSKDRRDISARFFAILRHRRRLAHWSGGGDARAQVLANLRLVEGLEAAEIAGLFDGSGYGPEKLSDAEGAWLAALEATALPPATAAECPDWLWPNFQRAFGDGAGAELAALTQPAPLDLRVNSLKATRDEAQAALAAEGIAAEPTPLSPLGLRVEGRPAVQNTRAFREGLVEPQDSAAQVAALLAETRPGRTALDFCAGSGGKALAFAAAMENQGRLLLHDIDPRRLRRAEARLARAGVTCAETSGGDITALEGQTFDRVFLDAPCSGTGTWRRMPDRRERTGPDDLARDRALQAELLDQAADRVCPGGRLLYATCSLLKEENGDQVAGFLARRADFAPLPLSEIWPAALPDIGPRDGPDLQMTPHRHQSDGFYVAALARVG